MLIMKNKITKTKLRKLIGEYNSFEDAANDIYVTRQTISKWYKKDDMPKLRKHKVRITELMEKRKI